MKRVIICSVIVVFLLGLAGCKKCDHTYDLGEITKDSTCTVAGEKTYNCILCGETKIEPLALREHSYKEEVTREATCAEEGEKKLTCTVCEATKTESTPLIEHTYKESVTKMATFKETGEKTFTCEICGDTYTETIPVRDDEIVVTVTDKINIPEDLNAHRYSDSVKFVFDVENRTDKTVKGVQGTLTIYDLFDKKILSVNCDFTGNSIAPNGSISVSDLSMEINQFRDSNVKLYNTDYSDLKFDYKVTEIVYSDESDKTGATTVNAEGDQKVTVQVVDKHDYGVNYDAHRYSPRVEFDFKVYNNTLKDIKGVQGKLIIKDLFNVDIMTVNVDFTGNTIAANGSVDVNGIGMDVNRFMDDHVKLYNTDLSDLNFEYKVTSIVYTDGTTE